MGFLFVSFTISRVCLAKLILFIKLGSLLDIQCLLQKIVLYAGSQSCHYYSMWDLTHMCAPNTLTPLNVSKINNNKKNTLTPLMF